MTKTELHAILGGLWPGLMKAIAQAMHDETAALQKRIDALEARKNVRYLGVHSKVGTYSVGDVVTRSGCLFYCVREANAEDVPGASVSWLLMHKTL